MLLVALNGISEVSQCCVHGAHVAQLASLGELALGLSRQQHTLFVACQGIGVVADSHVHVAQAAERVRGCLKSHKQPLVCTQQSQQKRSTKKTPTTTESQ